MRHLISRLAKWVMAIGNGLGEVFMLGVMIIIVANIVLRSLGTGGVRGTYELVTLMIVVTASFAIVETMVKKGHITMALMANRLPQSVRPVLAIFALMIGIVFWGVIAWAAAGVIQERWLEERSEVIGMIYFPFRLVWVLGASLMCIVLLTQLFRALKEIVKK